MNQRTFNLFTTPFVASIESCRTLPIAGLARIVVLPPGDSHFSSGVKLLPLPLTAVGAATFFFGAGVRAAGVATPFLTTIRLSVGMLMERSGCYDNI